MNISKTYLLTILSTLLIFSCPIKSSEQIGNTIVNSNLELPSMQNIKDFVVQSKDTVIEVVKENPYTAVAIGFVMMMGIAAYLDSKNKSANAQNNSLLKPNVLPKVVSQFQSVQAVQQVSLVSMTQDTSTLCPVIQADKMFEGIEVVNNSDMSLSIKIPVSKNSHQFIQVTEFTE